MKTAQKRNILGLNENLKIQLNGYFDVLEALYWI